ncbi:MAG: hypothetical protein HY287_10500 [Planctomycetes bacterium]|nr:hypothetical protein [Planctomycetota bacterium]
MVSKIFAVIAVLVLPLNLFFWHRSHSSPVYFRSDISQYQSLTIYLRDGVIGMYLLTMPTPTTSTSEFQADLRYDATPSKGNLHLSSIRVGDLTKTWLVFPFWLSTTLLLFITVQPVVFGPVRQGWRRVRGRCMNCGYDLTGNRSGRCSECGEHVQRHMKRPHPAVATRR